MAIITGTKTIDWGSHKVAEIFLKGAEEYNKDTTKKNIEGLTHFYLENTADEVKKYATMSITGEDNDIVLEHLINIGVPEFTILGKNFVSLNYSNTERFIDTYKSKTPNVAETVVKAIEPALLKYMDNTGIHVLCVGYAGVTNTLDITPIKESN